MPSDGKRLNNIFHETEDASKVNVTSQHDTLF
jgi:hypothetical protein